MENIDLIILTVIVVTAFVVFIIASFKEFAKMGKTTYKPNSNERKFGRYALYDIIEKFFDESSLTKEDKDKLIKTISGTIADMEYDGVYFPKEVNDKLEKEKAELFCEYSGLPSVKAYKQN